MKLVLLGAGMRGMTYARYAKELGHEIVAAADLIDAKCKKAAREFSIVEDRCFASAEELLQHERMGDAAIIATMDRGHFGQAVAAIKKGYPLLLEKPISPDAGETLMIAETAKAYQCHVLVCHVLRYTPFYREVKAVIDSGEVGRVITIEHSEHGNFHTAHSFVRGNWRRRRCPAR